MFRFLRGAGDKLGEKLKSGKNCGFIKIFMGLGPLHILIDVAVAFSFY